MIIITEDNLIINFDYVVDVYVSGEDYDKIENETDELGTLSGTGYKETEKGSRTWIRKVHYEVYATLFGFSEKKFVQLYQFSKEDQANALLKIIEQDYRDNVRVCNLKDRL